MLETLNPNPDGDQLRFSIEHDMTSYDLQTQKWVSNETLCRRQDCSLFFVLARRLDDALFFGMFRLERIFAQNTAVAMLSMICG